METRKINIWILLTLIFSILQIIFFGIFLKYLFENNWGVGKILILSLFVISTIVLISLGGLLLYLADSKYKGNGYLETASFFLMIPFLGIVGIYFFNKEKRENKNGI